MQSLFARCGGCRDVVVRGAWTVQLYCAVHVQYGCRRGRAGAGAPPTHRGAWTADLHPLRLLRPLGPAAQRCGRWQRSREVASASAENPVVSWTG